MLIHEVCAACKLTKKAVEYYMEQGLICPVLLENGYRDFLDEDIETLKKVSILRKLGLSVFDISVVLKVPGGDALFSIFKKKELEIIDMEKRQELIRSLAFSNDWEYARQQLDALEQNQTILEKLLNTFPGHYGHFISLHFARFLSEPINTSKQQTAFDTIISFLDNLAFDIPKELQEYLEESVAGIDKAVLDTYFHSVGEAATDVEKYMLENKEMLEQFWAATKRDEHTQTSTNNLKELLKEFCQKSGYNDVFIPAMMELSNSYREHHERLVKVGEIFAKEYPEEQGYVK